MTSAPAFLRATMLSANCCCPPLAVEKIRFDPGARLLTISIIAVPSECPEPAWPGRTVTQGGPAGQVGGRLPEACSEASASTESERTPTVIPDPSICLDERAVLAR